MEDSQIFEWLKFHPKGKWWTSLWNLRPEVIEELNIPEQVIIKDTTLREGEETPNVNMSLKDKLAIARMLSEMGIQEMDVGYAGAVERDLKFAQKVKAEGLKLKLAAHSRALVPEFKEEIDRIGEAGVEIVQIVLHPVPVEGYGRRQYSERLEEAVRYTKHQGLFTMFILTFPKWEMEFVRDLFQPQ